MASVKAERPVGTQLFGQAKKEPAGKASDQSGGPIKPPANKQTPKKAEQKPKEPKKKGKGGKAASKN